jgi:hypothetical protein
LVASRFDLPRSSRILAALSIYSADEKARAGAIEALRSRDPREFAELLVSIIRAPIRYEMKYVPGPGRRQALELTIEGEKADVSFLFFRYEAPDAFSHPTLGLGPRLSEQQRALARNINMAQAEQSRIAYEYQVSTARDNLNRINELIESRNAQVSEVLGQACGASFRPNPESARQWLSGLLGRPYTPAPIGPKPKYSQVVAPLFTPSFLPVPVPTCRS